MATSTLGTHRSMIVTARGEVSLADVTTPTPTSGQVLVKVLAFPILADFRALIASPMCHTFPLYPGGGCIGRVEAAGDDALTVAPGQLVYVDPAILGRDAPEEKIVHGLIQGFTPRQIQLSTKAWTQGTMSQKTLAPVESVIPLDEEFWTKTKGFPIEKIWAVNRFVLPFTGFELANLRAGEVVVIAFTTGRLGNAATELALTLGAAHVVGLGRSQSRLDAWISSLPPQYASRVSAVALTGDIPTDTQAIVASTPYSKGADIYYDFTPPEGSATASAHIGAGIGALKNKGRIVFMGNVLSDISFPYIQVVNKDLKLFGSYMYDLSVPKKVFRLVESGLLSIDHYETEIVDGGLDAFDKAIDAAASNKNPRSTVLIKPN